MIADGQVISIEKINYLDDYKLELVFNDSSRQIVDFFPFLSSSRNPHIRKYLDIEKFRNYSLDEGDLQWNDYDLCFPIADLYENRIMQ